MEQAQDNIKSGQNYVVQEYIPEDLDSMIFLIDQLFNERDIKIHGYSPNLGKVSIPLRDVQFAPANYFVFNSLDNTPCSLLKSKLINYIKENVPDRRKYVAFYRDHTLSSISSISGSQETDVLIPIGFLGISVPSNSMEEGGVYTELVMIYPGHASKCRPLFSQIEQELRKEWW